MKLIKNEKIINLMQRTLDCVDYRLNDHGKRVAYMVFKILKLQNKYDDKQLRDICIMVLLHDIGAYKTDEIDKMVEFETNNIWEHSIYGFLFLKHFSPLKELAPVVLFHHATCRELTYLESLYHELAQIISVCDRADIFSQHVSNNLDDLKKHFEKYRDTKLRSDIIELFFKADLKFPLLAKNIDSSEEFLQALYGISLTSEEVNNYLNMTVLSIDFRSRQTVIHTIAAVCIAVILADLSNLSQDDIEKIKTGAMLHDIGKTGIPIEILENPNRLSKAEMEVMKTHVNLTEKIITGTVDDEIKQIAVRHHEKLNGTGYPRGLRAKDLSLNERIFAVADIFSALCGARSYKDAYPKEKIINILNDMSAQGFIDAQIVSLSVSNFEYIMEKLNKKSQPIIDIYHKISNEYLELLEKVNNSDNRVCLKNLL